MTPLVGDAIALTHLYPNDTDGAPPRDAPLPLLGEPMGPGDGFSARKIRGEGSVLPGQAYGQSARDLRIRGAAAGFEPQTGSADPESQTISEEISRAPEKDGAASAENRSAPAGENASDSAESEDAAKPSGEDRSGDADTGDATRPRGTDGDPLDDSEMRLVQNLKQRDTEVRKHEQAHIAASGGYARGGMSLEYTLGPDGKRYATGGEVSIDTSPESSPEATARKMRIVRRAALAPASPSSQDRRVAAQASRGEVRAQREILAAAREEAREARAAKDDENADEPQTTETAPGAESASRPDVPTSGQETPESGLAPDTESDPLAPESPDAPAARPGAEADASPLAPPDPGRTGGGSPFPDAVPVRDLIRQAAARQAYAPATGSLSA